MKIYKFKFTCDEYIYEVSADFQVEAETREEADKKVMQLLYEAYPIAKTNNTARIKLIGIDCISGQQEPCEYCDEKRMNKLILSTKGNVQLKVGKQTGVEYYDDVYGWQDEAFEFNYCPMCGRKLEVEG